MFARAAVSVTACTNLVIERAVDLYDSLLVASCAWLQTMGNAHLVLLGTEDRGEIVGHGDVPERNALSFGEGDM